MSGSFRTHSPKSSAKCGNECCLIVATLQSDDWRTGLKLQNDFPANS